MSEKSGNCAKGEMGGTGAKYLMRKRRKRPTHHLDCLAFRAFLARSACPAILAMD